MVVVHVFLASLLLPIADGTDRWDSDPLRAWKPRDETFWVDLSLALDNSDSVRSSQSDSSQL